MKSAITEYGYERMPDGYVEMDHSILAVGTLPRYPKKYGIKNFNFGASYSDRTLDILAVSAIKQGFILNDKKNTLYKITDRLTDGTARRLLMTDGQTTPEMLQKAMKAYRNDENYWKDHGRLRGFRFCTDLFVDMEYISKVKPLAGSAQITLSV